MEASLLLFSLIESQGEGGRERGSERDIPKSGRRGTARQIRELVTRGRRGRGIRATRGIRGVSSVAGIFSVDGAVGTGRGEVRCKSLKERERRSPGKRGRQQEEEEEPELLWPGQLFVCSCDVRGCRRYTCWWSRAVTLRHTGPGHMTRRRLPLESEAADD